MSWDCKGLESCINITDIEKQQVWETLKAKDDSQPKTRTSHVNQILFSLEMRARYNPQRHYEIYAVEVEDGITEKDIAKMFEDDPQKSAELIRQRGNKIYSDRVNKKNIKIT